MNTDLSNWFSDESSLTNQSLQKIRVLRQEALARREMQRIANYNRPSSKTVSIHRHLEREQVAAERRLQDVVLYLMGKYAEDHNIKLTEMQMKIAEDPTALEQFYEEALTIIPERYRPDTRPRRSSFSWNSTERGTYVRSPEKNQLKKDRKQRKMERQGRIR